MILVSAGPSQGISLGFTISSILGKVLVAILEGGSLGDSLPVESLIFPEPQNVSVGLQKLAQKSSWEKQEMCVMVPGCPSSELLFWSETWKLEAERSVRRTEKHLGGLPLLPWIILFLAVVGGGDSLNIHCPKLLFHFQDQM